MLALCFTCLSKVDLNRCLPHSLKLEVGLPALEQRLQQQQKAVEDLGAALED